MSADELYTSPEAWSVDALAKTLDKAHAATGLAPALSLVEEQRTANLIAYAALCQSRGLGIANLLDTIEARLGLGGAS